MSQTTKVNLHERLKKHSFQHALIATFDFGARFFEDYALENFRCLQGNPNVTVVLDAAVYRDLLEGAVLDPNSFPRQANLRYLLHPIAVPGVFHPKVFFFASEKRGLLIIGSANCTSPGLGSNAEMVSAFDYEEGKNEACLTLFQRAYQFFQEIAARWPAEHFESNLNTVLREVPWITKTPAEPDPPHLPVFLTNLNDPLWDQLVARLPRRPITRLSVLSRFFDAEPGLLDAVVKTTGTAKVDLYTQNYITTLTPQWLKHKAFKAGNLQVRLCAYADDDHSQQLHGKAYAFACGKDLLLAMGSANFTSSALLRTARNGNLEVMLCYPPVAARQWSVDEWLDPDGSAVVLRNAAQLVSAPENTDEPIHEPSRFPIRVREAWVDDEKLVFRLCDELSLLESTVRLSQNNRRPFFVRMRGQRAGLLSAELDAAQQRRLREAPSIGQLGNGTSTAWQPASNALLIANLQDISTGGDVRRQRQIREARESPQRFMDVLSALSRSEDDERLKQFLTYCDIPIDLPTRLYRNRNKSSSDPTGIETFRELGARNLRYFEELHDAIMDFVARHHRRLERHIDAGTAKGIPNFLHILLTVAKLVLSQVDRLIVALEAEAQTSVPSERWFKIRSHLDDYYRALEHLLQITARDYLDAMLGAASPDQVVPEFANCLPDLRDMYQRLIQDRETLNRLRDTNLVIQNPGGRAVTRPEFFKSILSDTNWPEFKHSIKKLQDELARRLAA